MRGGSGRGVQTDVFYRFSGWCRLVKAKRYQGPQDVKHDFPTASFLSGDRVVFNIGGNKYRLIVTMRYDLGKCFIRSVLTHSEYDRRTRGGTL